MSHSVNHPDPAGFEALIRPHSRHLYRLAYRFTGNTSDAEDLVQDLLTKLFQRHEELLAVEKLGPWLTRVMYRLYIDSRRRSSRSPIHLAVDNTRESDSENDITDTIACDNIGPEGETERELTVSRLMSALNLLSEEHKTILTLHDVEGYTFEELQLILDCPVGTLKSRLHRARAKLRQLIDNN